MPIELERAIATEPIDTTDPDQCEMAIVQCAHDLLSVAQALISDNDLQSRCKALALEMLAHASAQADEDIEGAAMDAIELRRLPR